MNRETTNWVRGAIEERVPREREYRYSFNPQFNFFSSKHSFLRMAFPIPDNYACEDFGRDFFYFEVPSQVEAENTRQ